MGESGDGGSSAAQIMEAPEMPATKTLVRKSLEKPEEVRKFVGHGYVHVAEIAESPVLRGHFKPGWRWSQDVKPIAGTDSCEAAHVGYVISGRMRVRMNDGKEVEFEPGDLLDCPPGHDAWVVGDQECVMVDWGPTVAKYAKR